MKPASNPLMAACDRASGDAACEILHKAFPRNSMETAADATTIPADVLSAAEECRFAGKQSRVPSRLSSMPVRLHHIVIDAHDLPRLARFWTQALGWTVLSEREREIVIGTDEDAPVGICFMPVTDPKTVKNRVHLDLTSSAADRDQEIDRLLALGARRVDIGQTGAESWTVLADPEGNEFCVVRPKETLTR
jgi:predicted enzyme related to lactoylglutathione lyase